VRARWLFVASALAAAACLDAPPASVDGDGGMPAVDSGAPVCSWSALETLANPTGLTGPTLDASELVLIAEAGGELRLFDRGDSGSEFVAGDPAFLDMVNSAALEANPALAAQGLALYFTRGDVPAMFDVWVAERNSRAEVFGSVRVVSGLSDPAIGESGVAVWERPDMREIFYAQIGDTDSDLAHAACTAADTCEPLGGLSGVNSRFDEGFPTVSGDGLDLYFERDEGIFVAHRSDTLDEFVVEPTPLFASDPDTTTYHDPEISEDGNRLYLLAKLYGGAETEYVFQVATRSCQ
jgi:hypothetical protein